MSHCRDQRIAWEVHSAAKLERGGEWIPEWYAMRMTTQIAVRLPDELVEFLNEEVQAGARSRAAVVTEALRRMRHAKAEENDVRIYRELAQRGESDPELEAWTERASRTRLDIE